MAGDPNQHGALRRELGVPGATLLGLGSILGTGVFVSVGVAAGVAGPSVVLAIALAALVAMCNAFSSAQLAANHPVSGGTYEYGYLRLRPALGFTAGWMFLCAKSASAATAALGFAGYLLHALSVGDRRLIPVVAVVGVVALTALVLSGVRRSSAVNAIIVGVTILALLAFAAGGLPSALRNAGDNLAPFFSRPGAGGARDLLHATALMFVAYTGYGRIATLGEEVRDPRRAIPRAIVTTLVASAALYLIVTLVGVASAGAPALASATTEDAAPLEVVARTFDVPAVAWIVALGAVTAMLGVLLNLILGLSRVLLAMGRRGDAPEAAARLSASGSTPTVAVIAVGLAVAAITATGSIETAWTFSAFTVLIYYAITNLAALRLSRDERLYHPAVPACGLIACLFLAFWVPWEVWLSGLALIALGLAWHTWRRRRTG